MANGKKNRKIIKNPILTLFVFACAVACSEKSVDTGHQVPAAKNPSKTNTVNNRFSGGAPRAVLNDTGITWGGNYPKDINEDCSGFIDPAMLSEGDSVEGDMLAQQDCAHGRDAASAGVGFDYVKYDITGKRLPASASVWQCVLDRISGLFWEVKSLPDGKYGNAGPHDGDDLFTWYNSNIIENGGAVGDWNARFNQCSGYTEGQPMTYCNIDEFVRRVNEAQLCGFNDWRVPGRPELETLVHFGRTRPAIDTNFFPHTKNEFYWSRTATAGFKEMAWGISFQFGYAAPLQRNNSRPVRLVRDGNNNNDTGE